MPKSRLILAAAFALAAAPALAASPFDGTWKADLSKMKLSTKPDTYLLAKGVFRCETCTPPFAVPADGAFHPVKGYDYIDSLSFTVVDDHAVTSHGRKGGKTVFERKMTVSPDGRTLTESSVRTNLATGAKVEGSSTATRIAAAPPGANAVSGSWRQTKVISASEGATTQTLKVAGDSLTLSTPTGEGYTATFGGPPVMQKNDPGKTMVAVRRISDRQIVETDTRNGKRIQTYDMTVAPDGRTMTMKVTDDRNGSTDTVTMVKQ